MVANAYGMNKYEYLDRIVFSNMNIEYKDIKSLLVMNNNNMKAIIEKGKADSKLLYVELK